MAGIGLLTLMGIFCILYVMRNSSSLKHTECTYIKNNMDDQTTKCTTRLANDIECEAVWETLSEFMFGDSPTEREDWKEQQQSIAAITVLENYVAESPIYMGPVIMVHWSGNPLYITTLIFDPDDELRVIADQHNNEGYVTES